MLGHVINKRLIGSCDYIRNGRALCLFIIMVVCRKTSVLSILFSITTFSDLNSEFRQDH